MAPTCGRPRPPPRAPPRSSRGLAGGERAGGAGEELSPGCGLASARPATSRLGFNPIPHPNPTPQNLTPVVAAVGRRQPHLVADVVPVHSGVGVAVAVLPGGGGGGVGGGEALSRRRRVWGGRGRAGGAGPHGPRARARGVRCRERGRAAPWWRCRWRGSCRRTRRGRWRGLRRGGGQAGAPVGEKPVAGLQRGRGGGAGNCAMRIAAPASLAAMMEAVPPPPIQLARRRPKGRAGAGKEGFFVEGRVGGGGHLGAGIGAARRGAARGRRSRSRPGRRRASGREGAPWSAAGARNRARRTVERPRGGGADQEREREARQRGAGRGGGGGGGAGHGRGRAGTYRIFYAQRVTMRPVGRRGGLSFRFPRAALNLFAVRFHGGGSRGLKLRFCNRHHAKSPARVAGAAAARAAVASPARRTARPAWHGSEHLAWWRAAAATPPASPGRVIGGYSISSTERARERGRRGTCQLGPPARAHRSTHAPAAAVAATAPHLSRAWRVQRLARPQACTVPCWGGCGARARSGGGDAAEVGILPDLRLHARLLGGPPGACGAGARARGEWGGVRGAGGGPGATARVGVPPTCVGVPPTCVGCHGCLRPRGRAALPAHIFETRACGCQQSSPAQVRVPDQADDPGPPPKCPSSHPPHPPPPNPWPPNHHPPARASG
jgi:hypothetical protein